MITPTMAVINKSTVPMGVDFDKLIAAMQEYLTMHVAPVWGNSVTLAKASDFIKGSWAMVFYDDADVAGALAYHDLTPDGLPLSKVFVRTCLRYKESVSVAASHELVESVVDPSVNMMTVGFDQRSCYAYESADPVESESFPVQGIPMSDFVYPSYFETFHAANSVKFDHLSKVTAPFQLLPGGYQIVFKNGRWTNIFGSVDKEVAFYKEDRRGHRDETRQNKYHPDNSHKEK
jgi:hypothetical protein